MPHDRSGHSVDGGADPLEVFLVGGVAGDVDHKSVVRRLDHVDRGDCPSGRANHSGEQPDGARGDGDLDPQCA